MSTICYILYSIYGLLWTIFIIAKDRVAPQYRMSVILSTMVVGIAGYHYFRIFGSWEAVYVSLEGGAYVASEPFSMMLLLHGLALQYLYLL